MLRLKNEVEDRWSLRPRDLPSQRRLDSDPKLQGVENNAIYRMMIFRGRKVRFSFPKGEHPYPDRFNFPLLSVFGLPQQIINDLLRSPVSGVEVAQAFYAIYSKRSGGVLLYLFAPVLFLVGLAATYIASSVPGAFAKFVFIIGAMWTFSLAYGWGMSFFKPFGLLPMTASAMTRTKRWLANGAKRRGLLSVTGFYPPMLVIFPLILLADQIFRLHSRSPGLSCVIIAGGSFAFGALVAGIYKLRGEKIYGQMIENAESIIKWLREHPPDDFVVEK
jgi:hypothetical protein